MSRVVLIVDSDSGKMIDVAGNPREGGRYMAFAKRMLSPGKNPSLDYGAGGGDTLTVWQNGGYGKEIRLLADKVVVPKDLYVKNRPIEEIVRIGLESFLDSITGTDDEISVSKETDQETGSTVARISLAPSIASKIETASSAVDGIQSEYVSKRDLANAISGISVSSSAPPEDVRFALSMLLERLSELVAGSESSSSSPEQEDT